MKTRLASAIAAAIVLAAGSAWADKVAVLPFTAVHPLPKPEIEQLRAWTAQAVAKDGHTLPTPVEESAAEIAVRDGVADTSDEFRAAGRAANAPGTITGHVDRVDVPPQKLPDGTEQDGYTVYRTEIEACQVGSGRVESLVREIDPDDAVTEIAEMLALLVRPEGLANADIPWMNKPHVRKAKPAPPPPPPPPPAPPPPPEPPKPKHAYAEGRPIAIGASIGVTNALSRPAKAQGPSWGMPIGVVVGYAFDAVPGLEARAILTSQVVGPSALVVAAGGRYAIPVLAQYRLFVGPEVVIGLHDALGADKTGRFFAPGSAFASLGIGEQFQVEIAADLAGAFGGTGTLVLGGATARGVVRF